MTFPWLLWPIKKKVMVEFLSVLCACSYCFQIACANILWRPIYPICTFIFMTSVTLSKVGQCLVPYTCCLVCYLFGFYLSLYTESDIFQWLYALKRWLFVIYFSLTSWPLKIINTKLEILVVHNFKRIWNRYLIFVTHAHFKIFSSLRGCQYRFEL